MSLLDAQHEAGYADGHARGFHDGIGSMYEAVKDILVSALLSAKMTADQMGYVPVEKETEMLDVGVRDDEPTD